MDIMKLHQALQSMSETEIAWVGLLASGHHIRHKAIRFQRGVTVNRDGVLGSDDIPAEFLSKLEAAGVQLETYQARLGEPWKSVIPICARSYVRRALYL